MQPVAIQRQLSQLAQLPDARGELTQAVGFKHETRKTNEGAQDLLIDSVNVVRAELQPLQTLTDARELSWQSFQAVEGGQDHGCLSR